MAFCANSVLFGWYNKTLTKSILGKRGLILACGHNPFWREAKALIQSRNFKNITYCLVPRTSFLSGPGPPSQGWHQSCGLNLPIPNRNQNSAPQANLILDSRYGKLIAKVSRTSTHLILIMYHSKIFSLSNSLINNHFWSQNRFLRRPLQNWWHLFVHFLKIIISNNSNCLINLHPKCSTILLCIWKEIRWNKIKN